MIVAELVSLSYNLCWFPQPGFMGISLPGTGTLGWEAWCGSGIPQFSGVTSTVEIFLSMFNGHT